MDIEPDEYLNEWREVPLASVADIRFSGVNKISQPGEEPVRLCNYTDVYNNDYVNAGMDFMRATATWSEIERFGLQVGDVIITKDSETPDDIGIPTVVDTTATDLVCGYHLALLRPNQEEVDPTFLAKQLAHHLIAQYFGQQANGTTRYGLSTVAIANAPLRLPRLKEQRSASALMRMVDNHIAHTEAVIAKLNQVRAGMLHDLLNYGLDEHGQLRDPIAHPEQFKDSPLGRIPRGWDVVSSREIIQLTSGLPKTQRNLQSELSGNIPVYGGNGITGYTIKPLIRTSTVVIGRVGEYCGTVHLTPELSWITDNALFIRELKQNLTMRFLYHYFDWSDLTRLQSATGQPLITQGDIGELKIPCPNVNEQNVIVTTIEGLDLPLTKEQNELWKLKCLKSGLQDDLLTGRVRVPETIMEGAAGA